MKSIVVINGSPRQDSDSEKLAAAFTTSLTEGSQEFTVDVFKLAEMDVKSCTGCMLCKMSGVCSQIDDMGRIRNSLRKADLVILSSPVHVSHISSILHNFFERSLIDLHTFEYFGKPFVTLVSTNGSGEKEADKFMSKMGLLLGMIKVGFAFVSRNDRFKEKPFTALIRKTRAIVNGEKELKPTLRNRLYFYFMKYIVKYNPEYFMYEHKIWSERGWFTKKYRDVRV